MLKVKTTVTGLGQTWEVNGSKWGLDPSEEYLCFLFDGYVGASFPDSVGLCFSTVTVNVEIKFIIKITNAEMHVQVSAMSYDTKKVQPIK